MKSLSAGDVGNQRQSQPISDRVMTLTAETQSQHDDLDLKGRQYPESRCPDYDYCDGVNKHHHEGLEVHFNDEDNAGHERDALASNATDFDSGNGSDLALGFQGPEPPDGGYGWVICACAFFHQMIADGLLFSFGVLYTPLLEHFNSGPSATTCVGALMMGTSMVSGPLVGAVASRYSMRTAGLMGSIIAGVGLVASYFAPSILLLTVAYGIVTGVGIGFLFLTSILAVSVYFRERRALANGIAMCGSGVGVFVLSPVLEALVYNYGWQGSMLYLAGFALQGCVFASLYRELPARDCLIPLDEPSTDSGIAHHHLFHADGDSNPVDRTHEAERMDTTDMVEHKDQYKSIPNQAISMNSLQTAQSQHHLGVSTSSLHLSYWENVNPKQLSRVDLCQIGSMLTIPTVYSMKEQGLTHSRSAMTIEEKESYQFWRYNNYQCSSAMSACWRALSCGMLSKPVLLLLIISSMLWTGQSTIYTFIVDYAVSVGVSPSNAALLLSAIGITNTIGRLVVGWITDSPCVNSSLLYVISIAVAGCICTAIPFTASYPMLIVLAALLGISMATYGSLRSIVVVDLMGINNLAAALGLLVMFQGLAFMIVPPVSGAILEATRTYKGPFASSGACYLLSALFMVPILVYLWKNRRKQPKQLAEPATEL